jgi:PAS domain-containing protein
MKDELFSDDLNNDFKRSTSNVDENQANMPYDIELLSILKDAVIITDKNFFISYWNPAAEDIYGWNDFEVMGKKAQNVLKTRFIGTKRPEKIQEAYQCRIL